MGAFRILLAMLSMAVAAHACMAAENWPRSSPQAEGVDAKALESLDAELASGAHGNVDGMLIIRHGKLIFEKRYDRDYRALDPDPKAPHGPYNYYDADWHPWYSGNRALHTMQSVTKSVVAALYGIAQQQGKLPPLDTPALALLKHRKFADPDGRKARITLADLLTMRSGIAWNEEDYAYTDARNDCAGMEASRDWVQFVLDKPMAADPGTSFVYNSGVTMVLGEILQQLTGRSLDEYAQAELFGPLGIDAHYWKLTPTGLADAEGGLYLAPPDVAKIAALYMAGGTRDDRRLLPESWIRESLVPATRSTYPGQDVYGQWGYGYQWWLYADYLGQPAFGGSGYGGQYPVAIPELDLIVVFTSWNIYDKATEPLTLIRERIIPAVH